jgi:hypothetical protein
MLKMLTLFQQSDIISNAKTDNVIVTTRRQNDKKLYVKIQCVHKVP